MFYRCLILTMFFSVAVAVVSSGGEQDMLGASSGEGNLKDGNNKADQEIPSGVKLSDKEADKVVDGIFKKLEKINRIRAEMKRTEYRLKGKKKITYQSLEFEAPTYVRIINRFDKEGKVDEKDCAITIFDGDRLWELEDWFDTSEARRATVRKFKNVNSGADQKKQIAVGSAAIGAILGVGNVGSIEEIRDKFDLAVYKETFKDGKIVYHLYLKDKKNDRILIISICDKGSLPFKVVSIEKKMVVGPGSSKDNPKYRTSKEMLEITKIATNLDGLKLMPVKTFVFPLSGKMEVEDDKTGKVIPVEILERLVAEAKEKLEKKWVQKKSSSDKNMVETLDSGKQGSSESE